MMDIRPPFRETSIIEILSPTGIEKSRTYFGAKRRLNNQKHYPYDDRRDDIQTHRHPSAFASQNVSADVVILQEPLRVLSG